MPVGRIAESDEENNVATVPFEPSMRPVGREYLFPLPMAYSFEYYQQPVWNQWWNYYEMQNFKRSKAIPYKVAVVSHRTGAKRIAHIGLFLCHATRRQWSAG